MRVHIQSTAISLLAMLSLSGCEQATTPSTPAQTAAAVANPASAAWPTSLPVFGEGFPNPGDPCRRIGESPQTVNFLDDSASLVGCLSTDDAAKLGGTVVATLDSVTLVSVPNVAAVPGDGDSQGDATVAGTPYHATAQIRCAGYLGSAEGLCDAGVVRGTETGTYIDVTLSDGRRRTIFFNADGSFLSFSTAEADGTAAMEITSRREGDTTIATLGSERYDIPDVFVRGD
jgi:hypothetical protein